MIEELKRDLEKWETLLKLVLRNESFDNVDIIYIRNEINKIQDLLQFVKE